MPDQKFPKCNNVTDSAGNCPSCHYGKDGQALSDPSSSGPSDDELLQIGKTLDKLNNRQLAQVMGYCLNKIKYR
jgi:hypothetical protein